MIIDSKLKFATDEAVPTPAATAVMGDVVDLGEGQQFGEGEQMYAAIYVTEAFTSAGAANVEFMFSHGTTAALGTDTISTGPIAKADLGVGEHFVLPVPQGHAYGRYIGIRTKNSAVLTAGKVSAFMVNYQPNSWRPFVDAEN